MRSVIISKIILKSGRNLKNPESFLRSVLKRSDGETILSRRLDDVRAGSSHHAVFLLAHSSPTEAPGNRCTSRALRRAISRASEVSRQRRHERPGRRLSRTGQGRRLHRLAVPALGAAADGRQQQLLSKLRNHNGRASRTEDRASSEQDESQGEPGFRAHPVLEYSCIRWPSCVCRIWNYCARIAIR